MLNGYKLFTKFMRPPRERFKKRRENNLGIIAARATKYESKRWRTPELELLDAYYENRQYDHLRPWDDTKDHQTDEYVPVRMRSPRIKYAFAKTLSKRVASRLVGSRTFPSFIIEEDPDTQRYLLAVVAASSLQSEILEPMRKMLAQGSSFVRFFITDGQYVIQYHNAKNCYPKFTQAGELESMRIQYVYEDENEKDDKGDPVEKWYRIDLGQYEDVLYDNPEFDEDSEEEPVFTPVQVAEHNLGFVQGEWFRTSRCKVDGYALTEDILDFIDDINYSLSQSSQAVAYNQDPQLLVKGLSGEELEDLIRSSTKGWNVGKDGEATFLESNLTGVERANELRDKLRLGINDIARVVFLDPDKLNAANMSGKAMEILHGPLVELIEEIRPVIEPSLKKLTIKMAMANMILSGKGEPCPITIPPGFQIKSLEITTNWPPVFQSTMIDLQQKVAVTSSATAANLISRETGTRYLAKDFDVQDVEAEIEKIAAQPVLNPFGAF